MSCGCASTVQNNCPEVVPVTVIQTTIDLGDGAAFQNDLFSVDAGTITAAGTVITLAYPPVSANSLQLFRNGTLQRPTVDYTMVLSTGVITLLTAAAAGEVFNARYLAVV